MQFVPQGITARPAKDLKIRSSLVRRLVHAQDDPAKRRIRAWLSELNDEQLSSLGLTSDDIAALRSTQSAELAPRHSDDSVRAPTSYRRRDMERGDCYRSISTVATQVRD